MTGNRHRSMLGGFSADGRGAGGDFAEPVIQFGGELRFGGGVPGAGVGGFSGGHDGEMSDLLGGR